MSEIDDIFAGKALAAPVVGTGASKKSSKAQGKAKAVDQPAATDAAPAKEGKKRKKGGSTSQTGPAVEEPAPKSSKKQKTKPPEEVLDPSLEITQSAAEAARKFKRQQAKQSAEEVADPRPGPSRSSGKRGRLYVAPPAAMAGNDDDVFADSRGTGGGRKRTEEGYRIFSETELGINRPDAGETDLCPFDCDCCY